MNPSEDEILELEKMILKQFNWNEEEYPLEPKTFFYDWIFINALMQNEDLIEGLIDYNCFTDIEFNHKKSFNCQARSVAIFVGMFRCDKIDDFLLNKEQFIEIYVKQDDYEQLTLF